MVGWIKMPLVGLGRGHSVLDGDPVGTQRPTAAPPYFSAHVYCGQTVARLSNCWSLVFNVVMCLTHIWDLLRSF